MGASRGARRWEWVLRPRRQAAVGAAVALFGAAIAASAALAREAPTPVADGARGAARAADADAPRVVFMRVDGAIGPATTRHLAHGLSRAAEADARALVVELDTPGGLESAMRDLIRDILASPVPVVMHVTPSGARAASAGTFLVYASHVAAMAPATNLGAATPMSIGGMPGSPPGDEPEAPAAPERASSAPERKALNDALAFIRSLAELRGRDVGFAEAAVRDAATLSSSEALERGVIELIAKDRDELLRALEGRRVDVLGAAHTITLGNPARVVVIEVEQDWQTRLLQIISNPNLAYLLLLLGFYGLLFELSSPGGVLPGVAGAIALLVALFALQVLPVSFAGMALLILGIGLMVAEALVPSFGALGAGGLIAFVAGSLLLLEVEAPGFTLSRPLIAVVALTSAAFFILVLRLAWRSRRRPVVSGREELIGGTALVEEPFAQDGRGWVRVHGERWSAVWTGPQETAASIAVGERVEIVDVRDLTLRVRSPAAAATADGMQVNATPAVEAT